MSLTGLPDFARTLTLEDGPVWAAYGREGWLAPASDLALAEGADGRPAFRLSMTRPAAPFLPPEPFGVLDLTLTARRDPDRALAALRAGAPGAVLSPLFACEGRLRLSAADAQVLLPDEFGGAVDLALSGAGEARFLLRLSIEGAQAMERMLTDALAPILVSGAIGFEGVSPRLPLTAEFDPAALLSALSVGAREPPLSRDALAARMLDLLADPPIAFSDRVDSGAWGDLAQTLADRVAARFGSRIDAPGQPLIALPSAQDAGQGRFRWDLAQPVRATRWIDVSADPFAILRAFLSLSGAEPLIRRSTLAALPSGTRRVDAYANVPAGVPALQALGVTLKAPPAPPHRPAAATASAVFAPPQMQAELRLRLSPGEPLSYVASGFAVLADASGVRRVEAPARPCAKQILNLSLEDFGLREVTLSAAPVLLSLAVVEGEARFRVQDVAHAVPIELTPDSPRVSLAIPLEAEAGEVALTARGLTGDAALPLPPLPLSSGRLDLGIFPGYGPQAARLTCRLPAPDALVAIDIAAVAPEADPETLAFRAGLTEREWRYFARSPFAPGFRWRFSTGDAGAPWRQHPDPAIPLLVDPAGEPSP